MKFILPAAFLATIVLAIPVRGQDATGERAVEPSFCDLAPAESVQQSNTSFTEIFRFKLSDTGAPSPAARVHGEYLSVTEVTKCVRTWKFRNFEPGDSFLIAFRWEHGTGWTELRITSRDYSATFPKKPDT